MAVILDGFLTAASVEVDEDIEIDEQFTDLGSVSFEAYNSINQLFELGVAAGTGGDKFSPGNYVNRGQMALFVTRALAHTNARPIGISIQGEASGDTDDEPHAHGVDP